LRDVLCRQAGLGWSKVTGIQVGYFKVPGFTISMRHLQFSLL
jgi:hypothetical protein